jgi:PAS domain S-box-containing protein
MPNMDNDTAVGLTPTMPMLDAHSSSQMELRMLINHAPVAFWTCLPDGAADFLNQRWLDYVDLSAERAKGLGWSTILHPDDAVGHLQTWQRSVRTETPFEFESRIRRHDGQYRWHLARAEPLRDETGRIVMWCGTNIDIEDRRQAEDALRRNETYLSEAQRLSKTGSFSWTPSSGQMLWSDETFRILEISPSMKPTMSRMLDRVRPEDRPSFEEELGKAESGRPFDSRCRLACPENRVKYVRIVGRAVDLPRNPTTYAGALMDYTDMKLAEEKLHHAHSALAHVTRVVTLGELAASIAHEINQPLAGIVSNGEACVRWLNREIPDLHEVRARVEQMVADSRRAADVMRHVRSFVRKADPEYLPVDINDVVTETIPLIQREITEHHASLKLALGSRLPLILGDKIQLQQVLINLIVNAIQAMDDARDGEVGMALRTESLQGGICVSVSDAGIGIDPDTIKSMFDPFFSTKQSGLGMGLSICRSIIEAHGGEMGASNNEGTGATVWFTVPGVNGRFAHA